METTTPKENMFPVLREKAFSVTPKDLNLDLPADKTSVYGVIIDWNTGNQVATICTFITGDASLYIQSGQIYIGGVGHEPIRKYVAEIHAQAQVAVTQAQAKDDTALPPSNMAHFWLLTNKGKFLYSTSVKDLAQVKNEWYSIFDRANMIISFFRSQSEGKEVFTRDMIEQIRIDVSCNGESAISMLLGKDGTVNRQGDGSYPPNRMAVMLKTDGSLFKNLVNTIDDKIFEHAGVYDMKEKKGMPIIYRVGFLGPKPHLKVFEFRLGTESKDPGGLYNYLDRFVMRCTHDTEEMYRKGK